MTKKYSTKRSLVASILILCLCFTSFVGTTFAWFTDEVTSSGNKIVSGSLKIDLELLDKESGKWSSLKESKDPIFNYQNWEPGYIDAKLLKVDNEGTLALKWKAKFVSSEALGILADVIDVYVLPYGVLSEADAAVKVAYPDRDLENYTKVGTVREFVNTIETTTTGELLKGESAYLGIALKMQESAGNDYQKQSIGAFDIQIVATQLASEEDSFGKDYDEGAQFPGEVGSADEFIAALSNNENVKLSGDIDLSGIEWTPIALYSGILDGNGYAISNLTVNSTGADAGMFASLSGATIRNLALENVDVKSAGNRTGAIAGQIAKDPAAPKTVIENVSVSGTVKGGSHYTGGFIGADRSYSAEFISCVNNANVSGAQQVGGLIGQANRETVIDGCVNNGSVTADVIMAGGIVGFIAGDDKGGNTHLRVTVKNCINNGAVKQTVPFVTHVLEGGIAGAVGRDGGDPVVDTITAFIGNCKVLDGQKLYGGKYNYATGKGEKIVVANLVEVSTPDELVSAFANLKAGDAISILNDLDMSGKTISPVQNNTSLIMLGNGNTISNLETTEAALFVAHSGSSAYTFENIVLENCSVNSASNYGALFVGDGDTSDSIIIKNCIVLNSTVKSGKYAAAFIGYTAGYNVSNDGPVYGDVLIDGCSVVGGSIVGGGSAGVAIAHSSGNGDTTSTVSNLTVKGVEIIGEDDVHTGIAVGTAGVGKTYISNVTYTDVTGNYNVATKLYGRFVPVSTGELYVDSAKIGTVAFDPAAGTSLFDTISNLKAGETLVIPGGTYKTSGKFQVPAGVTLEGKAGETVIFKSISTGSDNILACHGDVVIRNITFETVRKGYAIADNTKNHDTNGDITVIGCTFKGAGTDKDYGIYKNLNGNLTVIDCTFDNYDNAICGVNNQNGSTTVISGCTFTNIDTEAIGYVASSVPADFEAKVIANNTGLTEENVIG